MARAGKRAAFRLSDVVFEPSEGWWAASIPGVPGAYSQGRTRLDAFENVLDALAGVQLVDELSARRPITDEEREHVERALAARFVSSADKDPIALVGMLRALWREVRPRQWPGTFDAFAVREEIRRRMRWEADVRAREDARDHAFVRAWIASHPREAPR